MAIPPAKNSKLSSSSRVAKSVKFEHDEEMEDAQGEQSHGSIPTSLHATHNGMDMYSNTNRIISEFAVKAQVSERTHVSQGDKSRYSNPLPMFPPLTKCTVAQTALDSLNTKLTDAPKNAKEAMRLTKQTLLRHQKPSTTSKHILTYSLSLTIRSFPR